MKTTNETVTEPNALFKEISRKYCLATPEQIKTRIIWEHVCMMHSEIFGNSEQNKKLRERYRAEFTVCEQEELRVIEQTETEQAAV